MYFDDILRGGGLWAVEPVGCVWCLTVFSNFLQVVSCTFLNALNASSENNLSHVMIRLTLLIFSVIITTDLGDRVHPGVCY